MYCCEYSKVKTEVLFMFFNFYEVMLQCLIHLKIERPMIAMLEIFAFRFKKKKTMRSIYQIDGMWTDLGQQALHAGTSFRSCCGRIYQSTPTIISSVRELP
jgi:hypothetical protein